ncbi:hypothetical protein V1264_006895 [Littorina saxatilis]
MANLLLVTIAFAVLLGSSFSEARPSYQPYRSSRRGAGGNPDSRQLSELKDMVSMLKGDVEELKDMNTMLKEDVQDLKEATDCPVVTFTALIASATIVVSADETIVFPLATSLNTAYDTTTGIFTTPVDGIYIISISIRPFDIDPTSEFAAVQLIKRFPDGSPAVIGRVISSTDDFDMSSLVINPYLEAGCEIFARSEVDASFSSGSIFSGVLIKQITIVDNTLPV